MAWRVDGSYCQKELEEEISSGYFAETWEEVAARRTAAGGLDSPWAVGALVRLVATVNLPVSVQTAWVGKLLSTNFTGNSWFAVGTNLTGSEERGVNNEDLNFPSTHFSSQKVGKK